MSLESKLEENTKALQELTKIIMANGVTCGTKKQSKETKEVSVPVVDVASKKEPVPTQASEIPLIPSIVTETPSAPMLEVPAFLNSESIPKVSKQAPFKTAKEATDYIITTMKSIEPGKYSQIYEILKGFGVNNLNLLDPSHYDAFYQKVEKLKD